MTDSSCCPEKTEVSCFDITLDRSQDQKQRHPKVGFGWPPLKFVKNLNDSNFYNSSKFWMITKTGKTRALSHSLFHPLTRSHIHLWNKTQGYCCIYFFETWNRYCSNYQISFIHIDPCWSDTCNMEHPTYHRRLQSNYHLLLPVFGMVRVR